MMKARTPAAHTETRRHRVLSARDAVVAARHPELVVDTISAGVIIKIGPRRFLVDITVGAPVSRTV